MFVIDTNVLVYAADRTSPAHARCRALLEDCRAQPGAWFLTWSILYEFLRVVTHPRVMQKPWTAEGAQGFVAALLAAPGISLLVHTQRHADVLAEILAETPLVAGNLCHDLHTVVLMREHGVRRIYTRDTDFHRFRSIEVIDPMTAVE